MGILHVLLYFVPYSCSRTRHLLRFGGLVCYPHHQARESETFGVPGDTTNGTHRHQFSTAVIAPLRWEILKPTLAKHAQVGSPQQPTRLTAVSQSMGPAFTGRYMFRFQSKGFHPIPDGHLPLVASTHSRLVSYPGHNSVGISPACWRRSFAAN